jgi:hypothetical protein
LAHEQKNIIKLWALPKYTHCSLLLWATYLFGKRKTLGKGYGVKCGAVGNTLGTYQLHSILLPLEYRELMELTTISPSMGSNTLIHEDLVENFLIIEDRMLLSVS